MTRHDTHSGHFHSKSSGTGSSGRGTATKQVCACERNWCPVCSLPKCRPVRDSRWLKGTLGSTYQKDFDGKHGHPGEQGELAYKDKRLVNGLAQFDPHTTYHTDYPPKKGSAWAKRQAGSAVPYRPFDDRTTYNTYHDGRRGPPQAGRAPPPELESAPFRGVSTQRADFTDWGPQNRPYTSPQQALPQLPFEGSSTYRDDFHRKEMPDRVPRLPPPLLASKNDANTTTYGVDYVEKPMFKPVGECCDNPHHPSQHIHLPPPIGGTSFLGNTTGRLYRR